MADLDHDLDNLAPAVGTAAGLAALRATRRRRTIRRLAVIGTLGLASIVGIAALLAGDGPDRDNEVEIGVVAEVAPPDTVAACELVQSRDTVEGLPARVKLGHGGTDSCVVPPIAALGRSAEGIWTPISNAAWDERTQVENPMVIEPGETFFVVVHNRPFPCPSDTEGYVAVEIQVGAQRFDPGLGDRDLWSSCGLAFAVVDRVSSEDAPVPPSTTDDPPACDVASFAGVRTDARAWPTRAGSMFYSIEVVEPCVLDFPLVTSVHDDGGAAPVELPDVDGYEAAVEFPRLIVPGQPLVVEVHSVDPAVCVTPLWAFVGFEIRIGGFTARSARRTLDWCAAEFVVFEWSEGNRLPPLDSVQLCDAANGLRGGPFVDFAGTPNLIFANGGTAACRIDEIDVVASLDDGSSVTLEQVVDSPPGIPESVVSVVIDPGQSLAVLIATSERVCFGVDADPSARASRFSAAIEGLAGETTAEYGYSLCSLEYTTKLVDGSPVFFELDRLDVDVDGRVCLLVNPVRCEPGDPLF